jgi:ABC-2 type transport system ATP-binding protein
MCGPRRRRRIDGMTDTSTPQDIVTVRGLRKTYGDRVVVDNLDLDIRAGEVVGLIGANGAGKTTTVECIQGLRRPDTGLLRVFGYDPAREPERLRALIGSQLQDSALPDRLRVAEAVRLFTTERARDGAELLERFGLAARHRSAFASLSGGERQRLFLVLALLNRPRLVILDELTQGLDPAARRDVWTAVAQLRDEGTTVLLVTHELDEAQALCSRVIALRGGAVLDQGTPAELIARHAGGARITFAASGADDRLVASLRRLPGVHEVEVHERRITVLGDRRSIAHVGAELVRRGDVPADLDVQVLDLEDALLHLLDSPDPTAPATPATDRELVTLP